MPKTPLAACSFVVLLGFVALSLESIAEASNPPQISHENPMQKKLPAWVYEVGHYWYVL
jgi:hypothetical protein